MKKLLCSYASLDSRKYLRDLITSMKLSLKAKDRKMFATSTVEGSPESFDDSLSNNISQYDVCAGSVIVFTNASLTSVQFMFSRLRSPPQKSVESIYFINNQVIEKKKTDVDGHIFVYCLNHPYLFKYLSRVLPMN